MVFPSALFCLCCRDNTPAPKVDRETEKKRIAFRVGVKMAIREFVNKNRSALHLERLSSEMTRVIIRKNVESQFPLQPDLPEEWKEKIINKFLQDYWK